MNLAFLQDFGPVAILLAGAAICVIWDLREEAAPLGGHPVTRWIALGILVLAFLASIGFWRSSLGAAPPDVEHGSFLIDRFALFFYATALAAAAALVLCGADSEVELEPHAGVYHALLLVSTAGVLYTASSGDLVSLAVGMAMTVLPLGLALGLRKTDPGSLRVALRSLSISGALLATFIAGEAILAGASGGTELRAAASSLLQVDPLLALGALLTLVGAAGQMGVFPFGAWRAGEGLSAPTAPALARTTLVSLAVVAALLRLLPGALGGAADNWTVTVAIVAGLTLIAAPVLALRQRRLGGSVAHLLIAQLALALAAFPEVARPATASILFLLLCFAPLAAASLGLLGSIAAQGESDSRAALRGLWARSPGLAVLLGALLLTLTGLPPLAVFFARVFTAEAALQAGFGWLLWVALLSLLLSALVAFRWLQLLFDVRVDGPEIALPGRTTLVGLALCGSAMVGFTVLLGPLMGIAARGALPPLFGP